MPGYIRSVSVHKSLVIVWIYKHVYFYKKREKIGNIHLWLLATVIVATVCVRKSIVSRRINKHLDLGTLLPKRKGKCGKNAKQLPELIKFYFRIVKFTLTGQVKTFKEIYWLVSVLILQQYGIGYWSGADSKKTIKKQLLMPSWRKNIGWTRKYKSWSSDNSKKVIFDNETHFIVQRYRPVAVIKSNKSVV